MTDLPRRKFIAGVAALFAAPAIVRASSLMPVRYAPLIGSFNAPGLVTPKCLGQDLFDITRRAFVPRLFVDLYYETPLLKTIGAATP